MPRYLVPTNLVIPAHLKFFDWALLRKAWIRHPMLRRPS